MRLANIVPPQPEQRCTDQVGNAWPCGRRARAAFEAYLRNRPLVCHEGAANGRMRCEVNGTDVAIWVLTQGWAIAAEGAPPVFRQTESDARRRGVGQFMPDSRVAEQAVPTAPNQPVRSTAERPRG